MECHLFHRFVDEYYTSQTCAKCFGRFDRNTRKDRFKVCRNCKPKDDWDFLPFEIIVESGHRALRRLKREARAIGQGLIPQNPGRLMSKVQRYFKNWQLIEDEDGTLFVQCEETTTVWHRDIVAAKCILYKGTSMT